jgi:hypothetical protein
VVVVDIDEDGMSTCFLLHLVWEHGCYAYPVRVVAKSVAFAHFVDLLVW